MQFSIIGALLHTVLIVIVAIINLSGHTDGPMFWLVFRSLDYPFGEVLMDSSLWDFMPDRISLFGDSSSGRQNGSNFWTPLIIFGVFGGLWWASLGAILAFVTNGFSLNEKN